MPAPRTPRAIRLFEGLTVAAVLIGLVSIALSFGGLVYALPDQPPSPIHALSYLSVPLLEKIAVPLFAAFAASRERSVLAKWLMVIDTLFLAARWLPYVGLMPTVALPGQLAIAQIAVLLAAVAVLFTRDARAWVGGHA